jgi:hypothetical protein
MKDKGRIIYGILFLITIPVVAFFVGKEIYNSKNVNATDIIKNLPETKAADTPKTANEAQASTSPAQAPAQAPTQVPTQPTASDPPETAPKPDAPKTDSSENSADSANADQNSYKNETLGISFNYPKDCAVALESSNILNISKGDVYWKIRFYEDKNKEDIQNWFGNNFDKNKNAGCAFLDPVIKVGTYDGKLVQVGTAGGKCLNDGNFAVNSDKTKVVKINAYKETQDNINKILTSFKFL